MSIEEEEKEREEIERYFKIPLVSHTMGFCNAELKRIKREYENKK